MLNTGSLRTSGQRFAPADDTRRDTHANGRALSIAGSLSVACANAGASGAPAASSVVDDQGISDWPLRRPRPLRRAAHLSLCTSVAPPHG
eukprot:scaffold880_cov384-Prasinococcus_capsulatus_cf.AAC.6